MGKTDKKLR